MISLNRKFNFIRTKDPKYYKQFEVKISDEIEEVNEFEIKKFENLIWKYSFYNKFILLEFDFTSFFKEPIIYKPEENEEKKIELDGKKYKYKFLIDEKLEKKYELFLFKDERLFIWAKEIIISNVPDVLNRNMQVWLREYQSVPYFGGIDFGVREDRTVAHEIAHRVKAPLFDISPNPFYEK